MKGKLGFLTGFGVGFVLGSKQGRGPYEKVQRWWRNTTSGADAGQQPISGAYGGDGSQEARTFSPVSSMSSSELAERERLRAAVESTAPDTVGQAVLIGEIRDAESSPWRDTPAGS